MKIFQKVKNDLFLNTTVDPKYTKKLKNPFFKSSSTQKTVKYKGVSLWNSQSLNQKKLSFKNFCWNINPISSKTIIHKFT